MNSVIDASCSPPHFNIMLESFCGVRERMWYRKCPTKWLN